jgi:hypothetical protein
VPDNGAKYNSADLANLLLGTYDSTNATARLWPKADALAVLQIEIAGAWRITERPTTRGKSLPISLPKSLPTTPK